MTVDEIKRLVSMREVVSRYNIEIKRNNMCSCPFHGQDKKPSMMIYKDSFFCFTCHATGDVFTFVQKMDNCDFKTAFYLLGGKYGKDHKASKMAEYHAQKAKEKRERERQKKNELVIKNNTYIHATRELAKKYKPLSDEWCYYMNLHCDALCKDEILREEVTN